MTAAVTDRRPDRIGSIAAVVAAALWFGVGYLRWRNLRAGASDLGIFDQTAWLLSRGTSPFVTSIGLNVFADHVSLVVLLFAPLYRIAATPVWWIAAQATCLGLTIVPLRRLADELGAPRWLATTLVAASPALWSAAVYDVHPVVFATPAVAWTLLAAVRGDRTSATWGGVAIALCRADAVTALLGIAVIAPPRVRRRLLVLIPIPLAASVVVPHLLGTWQTFDHYYRRLGTSWGDALTHPWRFGVALLSPTSFLQVLLWLAPLAFLPLLRPRWFVAMAVAGLPLLLSSWPGIPAPWYHHAAFIVPMGVAGALAGWVELARRLDGRAARWPRVSVAVALLVTLALASPLAPYAPGEVRLVDVLSGPLPNVRTALAAIGPTEGTSTSNVINGHLSRRVDAYNFPCPFPGRHEGRTCDHPGLFDRVDRVDVVASLGRHDLSWLRQFGRWNIRQVGGVTIARRVGTTPR